MVKYFPISGYAMTNVSTVNNLIRLIQNHMSLFGYESLDLPFVGPADLFLIKAGDQLIERLVTFDRHGRELALRPEFTTLAANYFIQKKATGGIARWQFHGHVFQDVFDAKEESYQRFSLGAELIGMSGIVADAEIIGMAALGLRALGLEDIQITIGHAGLTRSVLKHYQLDLQTERLLLHHQDVLRNTPDGKQLVLETLTRHLQSNTPQWWDGGNERLKASAPYEAPLPSNGVRTLEDITRRMTHKRQRATEVDKLALAIDFLHQWNGISGSPGHAFEQLSNLIPNELGKQMLQDWQAVIRLLEVYEVGKTTITIQPGLARSWEYYSGIVFEIKSADLHLGGGGRYDGLAQLLGSREDIPAVGFAYYMDSVLNALPSYHSTNHSLMPAVICFPPEHANVALSLAMQVRDKGIPCSLLDERENVSSDKVVLLKDDLRVDFQGKVYSLGQVELLIAHLQQGL